MKYPFVRSKFDGEYNRQYDNLVVWFKEHMVKCAAISLTPKQYLIGIHSFPTSGLAQLVEEATRIWRQERHYELSDDQLEPAFFKVAKELKKITINK